MSATLEAPQLAPSLPEVGGAITDAIAPAIDIGTLNVASGLDTLANTDPVRGVDQLIDTPIQGFDTSGYIVDTTENRALADSAPAGTAKAPEAAPVAATAEAGAQQADIDARTGTTAVEPALTAAIGVDAATDPRAAKPATATGAPPPLPPGVTAVGAAGEENPGNTPNLYTAAEQQRFNELSTRLKDPNNQLNDAEKQEFKGLFDKHKSAEKDRLQAKVAAGEELTDEEKIDHAFVQQERANSRTDNRAEIPPAAQSGALPAAEADNLKNPDDPYGLTRGLTPAQRDRIDELTQKLADDIDGLTYDEWQELGRLDQTDTNNRLTHYEALGVENLTEAQLRDYKELSDLAAYNNPWEENDQEEEEEAAGDTTNNDSYLGPPPDDLGNTLIANELADGMTLARPSAEPSRTPGGMTLAASGAPEAAAPAAGEAQAMQTGEEGGPLEPEVTAVPVDTLEEAKFTGFSPEDKIRAVELFDKDSNDPNSLTAEEKVEVNTYYKKTENNLYEEFKARKARNEPLTEDQQLILRLVQAERDNPIVENSDAAVAPAAPEGAAADNLGGPDAEAAPTDEELRSPQAISDEARLVELENLMTSRQELSAEEKAEYIRLQGPATAAGETTAGSETATPPIASTLSPEQQWYQNELKTKDSTLMTKAESGILQDLIELQDLRDKKARGETVDESRLNQLGAKVQAEAAEARYLHLATRAENGENLTPDERAELIERSDQKDKNIDAKIDTMGNEILNKLDKGEEVTSEEFLKFQQLQVERAARKNGLSPSETQAFIDSFSNSSEKSKRLKRLEEGGANKEIQKRLQQLMHLEREAASAKQKLVQLEAREREIKDKIKAKNSEIGFFIDPTSPAKLTKRQELYGLMMQAAHIKTQKDNVKYMGAILRADYKNTMQYVRRKLNLAGNPLVSFLEFLDAKVEGLAIDAGIGVGQKLDSGILPF